MKALQEQGCRIGDLCAAFGVSRSGYHRARTAAPSARACKDAQLAAELRELHRQSRGTYGRPRLTIAWRQRGWRHSPKRVARLLRSLGLRGVRRGRFRPQTTDSRHENGIAPNRLQDQAPPSVPDQVWVADITYIPTAEGWLYVAGVLDRCSPRVLGLAMGPGSIPPCRKPRCVRPWPGAAGRRESSTTATVASNTPRPAIAKSSGSTAAKPA